MRSLGVGDQVYAASLLVFFFLPAGTLTDWALACALSDEKVRRIGRALRASKAAHLLVMIIGGSACLLKLLILQGMSKHLAGPWRR